MDNEAKTCHHHGRAAQKIRRALGIKQDTVAMELGISQQAVSLYEQREVLDDATLEKLAQLYKVNVELIKNFDTGEEGSIFIQNNTFKEGSFINTGDNGSNTNNYDNPIEALMQLCKEKEQLLLSALEIERKKNEEFAKLKTEIDELKKEIKKK